MSNKKIVKQSSISMPRFGGRKLIIVIGLILSLLVGSGALAEWRSLWPTAEQKTNQQSSLAPSDLTPSTPSKEYVYAGDKLVATEEPIVFTDVPTTHPYYSDIMKMAQRGITLGCSWTQYCPDSNISRQEMAIFIIRALGVFNPPTPATQRFTDVPPSNSAYAFIEEMAVRQITLGCTTTTYCPGDAVTHQQIAAFIMRAKGEFNPPIPGTQRFPDVPPANPFYNFIERMGALTIWPANPKS